MREDKVTTTIPRAMGEGGATPGEEGSRAAGIAMYCVLLASYSLNAADRQLFPLLGHDVRQTFGFALATTGLLSTIFTLGLAAAGLPTGYLLARFSRKTVLVLGVTIFSAATALIAASRGFWDMLVYLTSTGVGEAMQLTVMIAIAANYFSRHRSAAIGSINFCFGIGAFAGPALAGTILGTYRSWRAPMVMFGVLGVTMAIVIMATVRPWFSETVRAGESRADRGGATSLLNTNTVILTALSIVGGLVMYGFTGMYPTFLREFLHYPPRTAGLVAGLYGAGALVSIGGGALGDRFSPRVVLSAGFFSLAVVGYVCFHPSGSLAVQVGATFLYGAIGSGVLYVNLAAFHVKALRRSLASRGSGMFVTSLYAAGAGAGYLMGALASRAGWGTAATLQISLLCVVSGALALALRPAEMSL